MIRFIFHMSHVHYTVCFFSSSVPLWRIQRRSSFSIKVASSPIILRRSHFSQQHLVLCLWEFTASGHYLHFLVFGKYPYVSRYWKSFTIYWQLFIALLSYSFNTLVILLDGNNLHFTMFRFIVLQRENQSIN